MQTGQDYRLLNPTISICFVDGVLFPGVADYHLSFRLLDPLSGVVLTDHLSIHFFELPKFQRRPEELATPLEAWLYFLRSAEGLDPAALPGPLDTPEIRRAMEALTMLSQVDLQKEIYEGRLKALRDERMRRIDALAEGRAEGLAEGLEKGALIGRIELAQSLLRREATPRAELEAMSLEALQELAAQLERKLSGEAVNG